MWLLLPIDVLPVWSLLLTIDLQIIAEDFLDNKMSVKDFVQAYKQERVVRMLGSM